MASNEGDQGCPPPVPRLPTLAVSPARGLPRRVRWERVGRIGLLFVVTIVMALYVEHALSYIATRSRADQEQSVVLSLQRRNAQLERQARSLNNPATIVQDARSLGMVRPGEQPYVILGSPGGR